MLLSFGFCSAGDLAAAVSTLTVKKEQAHLYAQQEERSEVLGELKMGDKLTPLANALGNEAWYLVQTPKGLMGWVRAADVEGTEELQKVVQDSDKITSTLVIPNESSSATPARSGKEITVPIEMNGALILVPVELNRSIKTYMAMDTGATLTVISPALAKRLRLTLGPKITAILANGATFAAPTALVGSLKVGNAEANGVQVTVQNFSPDPRIEGLLGLNFLSRFHTSIDSKKQLLTLAPR